MRTTREIINHFNHTLDFYIITFPIDPETKSNTTTLDTLTKLKIALNYYTNTINELITLENSERKDMRRLSLSCATVISQQIDDNIVEYITTYWEKGGKLSSSVIDSKMEVTSLMKDILEVTKDMEVVLRKYK